MKWLAIWYALASLATFAAYFLDKSRARRNRWRIPERTLHALALAGGFAGAFAAMSLLRHKNRKWSFWLITCAIALAHLVAIGLVLNRRS